MTNETNIKEFNNVSEIYNRADMEYWYQSPNPGAFDYLAAMDRAGASHVVLTEENGKKTLRPAQVGDVAHMLNGRTVVISPQTALNRAAASPDTGFTIEIIPTGSAATPEERPRQQEEDPHRRLEPRVHLALY